MIGRMSSILVVVALGLSGAAFAGHCPKDAQAIDHGLQSSKLDMATSDKIKELRDKGMELHKAGNHRESEKTLAEGMRMLLMAK